MKKPELIIALDVDTLAAARDIIESLGEAVHYYKVGSQLFTACGPAVARFIQAKGKNVFLDLKFHDIPNTVAQAVHSAIHLSVALQNNRGAQGVTGELSMLTVHTCGGRNMLEAAVQSAVQAAQDTGVKRPFLLGVTVLTSEEKGEHIPRLVLERTALAKEAGLDGVVASCQEAEEIRKTFGEDFVIVTPGIRPGGAKIQDQKRVATPFEAVQSGSSFLVVGRPVVQASDPAQAVHDILSEIASVES